MTSVSVTKSTPVIIGPSEKPTPATNNISLTSFDKSLAEASATCLLVFEHAIADPVESIKRALAQALVHYQPIAGRLLVVDESKDAVSCNGEGVLFVAAKASCALESSGLLLINNPPLFVPEIAKDLAVYAPAAEGRWGRTDPLLLMQVTEFSCGGFVVGATWSHVIADGEGMAQFLQAVGELARDEVSPLSVVPFRCADDVESSLVELSPLLLATKQWMVSLDDPRFASMEVNIPSGFINRIKAEFSRRHTDTADQTCTVFDVVTAVLWQCWARVVAVDDPNMEVLLVFAVNMRKHLGVRDGYYGNCVVPQMAFAKSGAVASGSIIDIVKIIKNAKEKVRDMFKNGKQIDASCDLDQLAKLRLRVYNTFYVTSWRNLGFEMADFGSGRPARVIPHVVGQTSIILPPCKGKDGANVSSASLDKEHASAFANELARFIT